MLDLASDGGTANWRIFASSFISAVGGRSEFSSLIDSYLKSPANPVVPAVGLPGSPTTFAGKDYSDQLGQLMNAYWICLNGPFAITGGFDWGEAGTLKNSFYQDHNVTFALDHVLDGSVVRGDNMLQARFWPAEGTGDLPEIIIIAHRGWVVALSFASVILIVASLVPPAVRYFGVRGPEMMMNVSSLATRSNPFIPLPVNGTYLDAPQRAKLLKHIKIRFGDVQDKADLCSLAISSYDDFSNDDDVGQIRTERMYE